MADTRDPKDQQSPPTPAETDQAKVFMTEEEVEPGFSHKKYETVNGIKMGHADIPKFLKIVYASLAAWALYYMIAAQPLDDRIEASPDTTPTVEAGAELFAGSCAGCHAVTDERKVGPGLKNVAEKLGAEELKNILVNGRPEKGMPAPPSLGMSESQVDSLRLYLETLK